MVQDGYIPPQDNCVVAEGGDYEEGECSDGEPPPPPPAPRPVNSQSFPPVNKNKPVLEEGEEGECESDEGECSEGELEVVPKKDKEAVIVEDKPKDAYIKLDTENTKPAPIERVPSPPKEPKAEPREKPPVIAKINHKLEDIATRKNAPAPPPPAPSSREREPNYRDRDYRERPNDWRPPQEGNFREGRNGHGFNDQRMRGPPQMERPRSGEMARAIPHPDFNRKPFQHQLPKPSEKKRDLPTAGMRPGDMPSLISLPPMPQLNSSKGKVPDFPPMPSPYGSSNSPRIPPPSMPNQPPGWNAPPARPPIMHPAIPLYPDRNPGNRDPNRDREHTSSSRRGGEHMDDRHIRDYYNFYNRAWEDYYKSDKGSSSDRHRGRDGRDRSPERGGFPPPMPGPMPGMPMPGMPGMPPGMPGMPPGMPGMPDQRGRSKESAWLRGLKANQKVLEEVKRKPEAVSDEEESDDEPKVHSRIVMKSPAIPEDQRSHRSRPTPDDQGSYKSHHTPDSSPEDANGHPASRSGHGSEHGSAKRLTPERYRGVYERKPLPTEERKPRKKSEERKRVGDVEWRDPWMRPGTSPKDRKRPLSKSSSSSDSSSGSSSPDLGGSIQALKAQYKKDKARRKKEFLDAEKLRKLKHKLSPSDYEMLVRKRSREMDLPRNYAKRETRNETESESDGESGSSSSSSIGSASPGMAGKLADSPTSPPSSPDLRRGKKSKVSPGGSINSTKRKKEILLKELQKVEDKLKRKKDDTRKHR